MELNITGLILGAVTFIIIGAFHPLVIKAEYQYGKGIWPVFLLAGIIALVLSVFVETILFSAILGVFGFSALWSIRELFDQERRVKKGWFPVNPKRVNRQKRR